MQLDCRRAGVFEATANPRGGPNLRWAEAYLSVAAHVVEGGDGRRQAMSKVVNIEHCFGKFSDTFAPKIVGELNGQHVKLARLEGDKVPWHTHDDEDELFFVVEGVLDVVERDEVVTLHSGEFTIVSRGREHRVVPHGHVKLMLFEPAGIAHTGKVRAEITQDHYDRLDT